MTRLRVGIGLVIVSWLPVAQVVLLIAHNNNALTSSHASDLFRLSVWGVQIIIGLVGVWLAGSIAVNEVKQGGWKKAPARLWRLLREGDGQAGGTTE